VFLDSGGFGYLKSKRVTLTMREYADRYYEELPRYGYLFSGCGEVDSEELGVSYREDRKQEMLDKGVPIVPVIHGEDLDTYESMGWFDRYPYISVASDLIGDSKHAGYLESIYAICEERGVLLHGLGATNSDSILNSNFYSVGSSAWLSGARYGETHVFQNGRIRYYDKTQKKVRARYRQRCEENGLEWAAIEADKFVEVNMMNGLAWKQWAEYISYTCTKCYWLTEEEKANAVELKQKAFNTEGLIDRDRSIERAAFRRIDQITDASYDDRAHEILNCNSCHVSGRCPRYKRDQPCGYDVNVRMETKEDLQKALKNLLETGYSRVMTGILFEKLEGGVLDKSVSDEAGKFIKMIQDVQGIYDPRPTTKLTLTSTGAGSDGSVGTVASALASVFQKTGSGGSGSGLTATQRAANKIIDVTPEENKNN
jgi:hypothetical protein